MRKKSYGTLKVRAISGTYVVFLAFDMKESDAAGLMGFAIQRTRLRDGETLWLRGNKRFPSCGEPVTGYEDASSHSHPFQAFQWADYSAEPGERYRYKVIPMSGQPCALTEGPATSVTIETEPLAGTMHDVHWNRGAIASQAFVRRYPNKSLDEAGPPAYEWLARDLLPGLLAFIGQASDATFSIRAAIYEFAWPAVLAAFRQAHLAGADVEIVYHAKVDDTGIKNDKAIDAAQIKGLCKPRVNADLMHNKFIVLLKNGAPVSVWTGSTNFSRNALHGQLNVGHAIHDPTLAQQFLDYWTELRADPDDETLKDRIDVINPLPPPTDTDAYTAAFSPRHGRSVFDWWLAYANRKKPLFMTFPFGIVKDFRPVFDKNDKILRFGLLDKYVNGGNAASRAAAIADIERIRRFPNIGDGAGQPAVRRLDRWLAQGARRGRGQRELDPYQVHAHRPARHEAHHADRLGQLERPQRHRQRRERPGHPWRQARRRHLLRRVHAAVRPPSIPRVCEAPPRGDPGRARHRRHDRLREGRLVEAEGPVRGSEGLGARPVQAGLRARHQAPLLCRHLTRTVSNRDEANCDLQACVQAPIHVGRA